MTFQQMCLNDSASNIYDVDTWMLRYLVEFALPLERSDLRGVSPAVRSAWTVDGSQSVLLSRNTTADSLKRLQLYYAGRQPDGESR